MQEAVDRHQMQHLFAARLNDSTIQKMPSQRIEISLIMLCYGASTASAMDAHMFDS
jgi:hypothetical protein